MLHIIQLFKLHGTCRHLNEGNIFHCAPDMGFVHLGSAKRIQVWSNTAKGTHSLSSSNSNGVHVSLETQAPGEPDSKYVKLVYMLQGLATHE